MFWEWSWLSVIVGELERVLSWSVNDLFYATLCSGNSACLESTEDGGNHLFRYADLLVKGVSHFNVLMLTTNINLWFIRLIVLRTLVGRFNDLKWKGWYTGYAIYQNKTAIFMLVTLNPKNAAEIQASRPGQTRLWFRLVLDVRFFKFVFCDDVLIFKPIPISFFPTNAKAPKMTLVRPPYQGRWSWCLATPQIDYRVALLSLQRRPWQRCAYPSILSHWEAVINSIISTKSIRHARYLCFQGVLCQYVMIGGPRIQN